MTSPGRVWDEVATIQAGDQLTILLAAEIDIATAAALRNRLQAVIAACACRTVVVDLADVEFCDAAGVRSLADLSREISGRGGTLRLRGARPHIAWLVEFLGSAELLG